MPSLTAILTLGLFGRSKIQSPIRIVYATFRPPKFNRPSESRTLKVVKKYFPEQEHEVVLSRITDTHGALFLESEEVASDFFSDLIKIGFDPFNYTLDIDERHYFSLKHKGYKSFDDCYISQEGKDVSSRRVRWNSNRDALIDVVTQLEVQRVGDLGLKEAIKYVTKQQKAAA